MQQPQDYMPLAVAYLVTAFNAGQRTINSVVNCNLIIQIEQQSFLLKTPLFFFLVDFFARDILLSAGYLGDIWTLDGRRQH
jgi:hypothetical protein